MIDLTKTMVKTTKDITGEQCILKGDDGLLVTSGVNKKKSWKVYHDNSSVYKDSASKCMETKLSETITLQPKAFNSKMLNSTN